MFEWDDDKNKSNLEKHGISFEEAAHIFDGPILSWTDERKEYGETRTISLGAIAETVIVVVVHTERNGNYRIISARLANKRERSIYNGYRQETN